jgi:hypothetical protein
MLACLKLQVDFAFSLCSLRIHGVLFGYGIYDISALIINQKSEHDLCDLMINRIKSNPELN